MASINFFTQELDFKVPHPRKTKAWIKEVIRREKKTLQELNYIFCSDAYLLTINEQYLNHKTFTDIITFDNSGQNGLIEGDIFISIERVADNAYTLGLDFEDELLRVMIHGVLHLSGYKDKNAQDRSAMRKKEDACLSLRRRM